jgi:hypothetical protein
VAQIIVRFDKVRFDDQRLLNTGNGGGVVAPLIMDQTQEVQRIDVLRTLLENLSVEDLGIGQSALPMMSECLI